MKLCLWLLHLLAHHFWMIVAVVLDMEAPMTSSWLEGDWSTENQVPELVTHDLASGCICRAKLHQHVVCYGGSTCSKFPTDITLLEDVVDLRVKTTEIRLLSVGDLGNLTFLQYLEVDANFHLSYIQPGVFANMSHLQNLSISFNNELRYLADGVFQGLDNLLRLRLVKNGFLNIIDVSSALRPTFLPNLESLSLSENVFRKISKNSFSSFNGTRIKELDLILCQMEQIHPKSLVVFRKLEILRLGENLLTEESLSELLMKMVFAESSLEFLNLYELGFRHGAKLTPLLKVIAQLPVTHLILTRNHLETLYKGLFPYMPNIRVLDLREVSAVDIEQDALSQAVLPRLETLLLGRNKLPGALDGVLLPQLLELDLSMNSGNEMQPSYLDVSSTTVFQNMSRLTSLNLSFNRLNTISNYTFSQLDALTILGLKNATIYFIAEGAFENLRSLYLLNLDHNPFKPFNEFRTMIFNGLAALQVLRLSYCGINHFYRSDIFQPLVSLKYLYLQHNNLVRISPSLFPPAKSLVGIDLTSNMLLPWSNNERLFSTNPSLQILLLANNRLTYLTTTMMNDFYSAARLDLSMNPFVCNCASFNRTTSWLISRNLTTNDTNIFSPLHLCVSPDSWRDRSIVEFIDAVGPACLAGPILSPQSYQVLYVSVITSLLLLCVVGALCYIYRWYIRYWLFLAKMAYIRHHVWFRKERQSETSEFKYDAFVSYSNEDRNFVVALVAMLENHDPYLKLCVYERDFEIGTMISDTVLNKVEASRRTLLIVSDAFARSQWCMWELQIAEYHQVFFKGQNQDDSLLMIKLGAIADSHITPTLRYLMKTRIYLEWNADAKKQKVFWEKLRTALGNK